MTFIKLTQIKILAKSRIRRHKFDGFLFNHPQYNNYLFFSLHEVKCTLRSVQVGWRAHFRSVHLSALQIDPKCAFRTTKIEN